MCMRLKMLGVLAVVGAALLMSGACAAPPHRAAAEPAVTLAPLATQPSDTPAVTPPPATTRPSGTLDVQRRRAELERRLEIASLNLAKAQIEIELGQLKYRDAIARADTDFVLAKKRLQVFERMTAPNRRARAELDLQLAEDNVAEAQDELYQLELKYSAEEAADRSREIVIERARRRLERAQRDLELRREEFKTLTEVLLPLEQEELAFIGEQKKRAALQVQRDDEGPSLDRKMAVLSAEAEVQRLEEELRQLGDGTE